MPPAAAGGIVVSAGLLPGGDTGRVKLSEFESAMDEEFGALGRVLRTDLVIAELDGRTVDEALGAGIPAAEVWLALCRVQEVPRARWHGRGRPDPQK